MDYVLLVVSSLCNGLKSVYAKKGNACISSTHNIYTYNFYMFLIAFVIMVLTGIPTWNGISWPTVGMATLYGLALVFAQVLLIKAMDIGGVSVSSLFYSCGFLVPIFASIFVYDEPVSVVQIIGVAFIVLSFIITVEKGEKTSFKWLILALSALLCNGTVGFLQKAFRMSSFGKEQSAFMIVSFFAGAVVAFLLMPKQNMSLPPRNFLKTVLGSGITLGLVNAINVYVSGVLPGIIVFPSVNGGGIIASSILARILIGEKLSVKKKIGIALGIVAICLIAL